MTRMAMMQSAREAGAYLVDDADDPEARAELTARLGRAPRVGHLTARAETFDIGKDGDVMHVRLWRLIVDVSDDDGHHVARFVDEVPTPWGDPAPGVAPLRAATRKIVAKLVSPRPMASPVQWVDARHAPALDELPFGWRDRMPRGGALVTEVRQPGVYDGVAPGDVVLTIDGQPLRTAAELDRRLSDGRSHQLRIAHLGEVLDARADGDHGVELVRR